MSSEKIDSDGVLAFIGSHDGQLGWYQLERAIPPARTCTGSSVMAIVKELVAAGLVVEIPGEPMPRYSVSAAGHARLDSIAPSGGCPGE